MAELEIGGKTGQVLRNWMKEFGLKKEQGTDVERAWNDARYEMQSVLDTEDPKFNNKLMNLAKEKISKIKVNESNIIKLLNIFEGRTKRELESNVESKCNCGAGASIDSSQHNDECPAKKYLKSLSY